MVFEVSRGSLWREAFAPRKGDPHDAPRKRLLDSLERMRDNVAQLVTTIPADCKDLTIHDVSHLDALWEMASLIAGSEYALNPAEAFVLGGAILLHDAGLSVAAFPGGLEQIKQTQEWQDLTCAILRQHEIEPTAELIEHPPAEYLGGIKFAVLRALHAGHSERLASASWQLASGGQIYLLEDVELREAFGSTIGRVAHSHHWDITRVAEKLVDNIGAGTMLPADWAVSERKVACLLRCADAAHIDRRRAPTILYAATRPTGVSNSHWNAQNKINKPVVEGGTLIYSAGQPFKAADAGAWWLAYDLVRLVDKEIRAASALLEELQFAPLQVQRVLGAESPRALSIHIRPEGWRPIDAEIRVSDPIHLAQTLGGRHLYGRDRIAPIRELLQNAADAIRARRSLEERSADWGKISVSIEAVAGEENKCWLHVDDNGIGMSERVLCGPLVDFGKSIWSSPVLREEYPGLQSKRIHPVGKFGIGFFSVFEIAQYVKVVSKHYEAGMSDANVLEFSSISTRPLIRRAEPRELPRDVSTRVSIRIEDQGALFGGVNDPDELPFDNALLRLILMLDVQLEYKNPIDGTEFIHSANPYTVGADTFIRELIPAADKKDREALIRVQSTLIRPMLGSDGSKFGRASLLMSEFDRYNRAGGTAVSVGGFIYTHAPYRPFLILGVLEGNTDEAARKSAYSTVPKAVLSAWASEQARIIDRQRFSKADLLTASQKVILLGGDPGMLPYCFAGGRLITYGELRGLVDSISVFNVLIGVDYASEFCVVNYSKLSSVYFDLSVKENVVILADWDFADRSIFRDDIGEAIKNGDTKEIGFHDLDMGTQNSSLDIFIQTLRSKWACEPRLFVEEMQIFSAELYSPPELRWVLSLRRS
ncbi:ATP-binding protein [Methylocystis sp. 9N]|uniref:ATP-binding protein n=1 Tax=Methylocystis borbori TaxID=3118750 RepID=A0ABU7XH17_9HYPH